MQVITLPHDWYPDDINSKLNFDEFADEEWQDALFVGVTATKLPQIVENLDKLPRSVYINLEHPCTLYGGNNEIGLSPVEQTTIFNEVYTICPYTADWINELQLGTKAVPMPYMHNLKYNVYADIPKTHDVAYCGLIHHEEIASYIRAMSSFKYIFTTIPDYNRVSSVNHLATHAGIPNVDKWGVLATSKTAVIQNNLYLTDAQIAAVRTLPEWDKNEAFSHIDEGLLPQLKSRTVESALCKSLMLVKRDPWNVIEYWFKPGEDFVYFDDAEDLAERVREISTNYEKYEQMIENAYNKVVNFYNTRYIFQRIKEGLPIL